MNAGGMPNTCKSNGNGLTFGSSPYEVTRRFRKSETSRIIIEGEKLYIYKIR